MTVGQCGSGEVWEIMTLILSKTDALINTREILTGFGALQSKRTEKSRWKGPLRHLVDCEGNRRCPWMMNDDWRSVWCQLNTYYIAHPAIPALRTTKWGITSLTEHPPAAKHNHLRRDLNIFKPLYWFFNKAALERFSIWDMECTLFHKVSIRTLEIKYTVLYWNLLTCPLFSLSQCTTSSNYFILLALVVFMFFFLSSPKFVYLMLLIIFQTINPKLGVIVFVH